MPLTPRADAAIFDFDGVIIDSLPPVTTATNGALVAHGFTPHSDVELERFIGPPVLSVFAELTGAAEESETVAACVATYHDLYRRVYLDQTRLMPGVPEVLAALGLPLALATSKAREFVVPLLEHFGLQFPVVSAPELAEPKAETVARALQALGAPDAVMVGDRYFDVEAAQACGLRTIGVTWGVGDRDELSGAEIVIDQPAELLTLLA